MSTDSAKQDPPDVPRASQDGQEVVRLDEIRIDPSWALRLPPSIAFRHRVLPLSLVEGELQVACLDPRDNRPLKLVERQLGHPVRGVKCDGDSLKKVMGRIYAQASRSTSRDGQRVNNEADGSVALCDELLESGLLRAASDIHVIPQEDDVLVCFRVDGQLETFRKVSIETLSGLISRFKVLAGLDIAEKRAPQDGRFTWSSGLVDSKIDVRVATLPTRFGERMTLRLLSAQKSGLSLTSLGFGEDDLELFRQAIKRPYGMILLTGPTGSGKSTTLYSGISELLRTHAKNVITVEDPVEYEIEGASQVEVDSVDKVSFYKALRGILRHDPDVIMIGEIRDGETAEIATKAAMTGHLVFSTLHTNTAAGVVTRLIDMGLQSFLVAATLRLVVSQRLVRRLCERCRMPCDLSAQQAMALGQPQLEGSTVWEAKGCVHCAGRGYDGRLGLFELLSIDESMSKLIGSSINEANLVSELRSRGARMLIDDAISKLQDGKTTVSEVMSAITVW